MPDIVDDHAVNPTTARLNGGGSERKKVRFEAAPNIIPDAWFDVLSEGASFLSFKSKEQLREKLQGRTIRDVKLAFGKGRGRQPGKPRLQ